MTPRTKVDPRLLGLGLLTGAAVGVWAGRRAQEWTATQSSGDGLIDWERARTVAVAMNRDAALTMAERTRLDREYYDLVQQTIPLVAAQSGVSLPRPLDDIYAFDRVDWINANIEAFKRMFEPLEQLDIFGNPDASRSPNALWSGLNRTVVSAELGLLLGYLARRVLGQYDLALLGREPIETTGKLYFVQPNIRNTERTLGIPPDQFRLWLALHETTHAFEFEAYPWVREHMNAMIQEYFTYLTQDIEYLKRGLSGLKAFWERARTSGSGDGSAWIEIVMTPDQRRLFNRMQATMSVVEGYSNYIMNAVGRDLMPDYSQIARRFEQRQRQKSTAEQLLIKLTGLEMKMEQYRLGEAFINEVVRLRGDRFAHRVWDGPEMLPTMDELREPADWVARIDTVTALGSGAASE